MITLTSTANFRNIPSLHMICSNVINSMYEIVSAIFTSIDPYKVQLLSLNWKQSNEGDNQNMLFILKCYRSQLNNKRKLQLIVKMENDFVYIVKSNLTTTILKLLDVSKNNREKLK